MNTDDNAGINYKFRQLLNQGIEVLDPVVVSRLQRARKAAVNHQKIGILEARFVSVSGFFGGDFPRYIRNTFMIVSLSLCAFGAYYWNGLEQAHEHEEIDSALLADELPPSAYLDPGFQVWLESTSHSFSPQN
jgi:hypothetical protein